MMKMMRVMRNQMQMIKYWSLQPLQSVRLWVSWRRSGQDLTIRVLRQQPPMTCGKVFFAIAKIPWTCCVNVPHRINNIVNASMTACVVKQGLWFYAKDPQRRFNLPSEALLIFSCSAVHQSVGADEARLTKTKRFLHGSHMEWVAGKTLRSDWHWLVLGVQRVVTWLKGNLQGIAQPGSLFPITKLPNNISTHSKRMIYALHWEDSTWDHIVTRSSLSTRVLGTQNVLSSLAGQPMVWPHVLPVELLAFPWQLQSWSEGKACNTRLPIAVWQCELQCGRAIILILFIWGHWWIWSWKVSHLLHEQEYHSMWPQHEGWGLEAHAQFQFAEGRCSTSQLFRSIGVACIQTAWQSHFLSFKCIYCVFHPFAAIACSFVPYTADMFILY